MANEVFDLLRVGVGIRRQTDPVDRDVAWGLRPHLRRALLDGLAQIDGRRALLVLDRDQFCAVLCGRERLADHDGDRLADVPHGLARQRRTERQDELRAAAAGDRRVLGDIAELGVLHVGGGQHRQHTRHRFRGGCIDRLDIREGVGRADEIGMDLTGHGHVGGEASKPAHQRVVFQAWRVMRAAFGSLRIHDDVREIGRDWRKACLYRKRPPAGVHFAAEHPEP